VKTAIGRFAIVRRRLCGNRTYTNDGQIDKDEYGHAMLVMPRDVCGGLDAAKARKETEDMTSAGQPSFVSKSGE